MTFKAGGFMGLGHTDKRLLVAENFNHGVPGMALVAAVPDRDLVQYRRRLYGVQVAG